MFNWTSSLRRQSGGLTPLGPGPSPPPPSRRPLQSDVDHASATAASSGTADELPASTALGALSPHDRNAVIGAMRSGDRELANSMLASLASRLRFDVDTQLNAWDFAVLSISPRCVVVTMNPSMGADFAFERLLDVVPLLNYIAERVTWKGQIGLSFGDTGHPGQLAFSFQEDGLLIPDCFYLRTEAYAGIRAAPSFNTAWKDRRSTVMWRGSTTGVGAQHWTDLPRAKLCMIANQHYEDIGFDVGFTHVVQERAPTEKEEIRAAGLMRPWISGDEFGEYKYHIDIDGNTNSWSGLFQKLLSGGLVFKVAPNVGDMQWYYRRMQPWLHYVPVERSLSNLREMVLWAMHNDERAREIAAAGRRLAESMTLTNEADFAVAVVNQALARMGPDGEARP